MLTPASPAHTPAGLAIGFVPQVDPRADAADRKSRGSMPLQSCLPRACAQLPSQPARALLESVDQGDGSIATPAAALPMFEVEEIR